MNPYDVKGSILQLEKVNFPPGEHGRAEALRPTNCLAISAKRYVLFDRSEDGEPVIRKASRHGLGHMLPPYKDPDSRRVGRIGVQLWQEDLWRAIIEAYDRGRPDQPDLDRLPGLDQPAATRYAATNQTLLGWFKGFNGRAAPADRVRPFNFLLTYQLKSRLEMAHTCPDDLQSPMWRGRTPTAASRYSSDLANDQPDVFDRKTGEPIPWAWLRSYRRALAAYHLHSESKFRGGEDNARGTLARRHVEAWAVIPIGKEADNLEEREVLGEGEESIEWEMARSDRARLLADIESTLIEGSISDRLLIERARVSRHTLSALRNGRRATAASLLRLARATEELRLEFTARGAEREGWLRYAHHLKAELGGRNKLADILGVSRPYMGRLLKGEKPMTAEMIERLAAHRVLGQH